MREALIEAVLEYIKRGWSDLIRSMNDCSSFHDVKIATYPVLYLPAGLDIPPRVIRLREECNVQVRYLPREIERLGDVKPDDLPSPGLLYLPNPYIVPGGRFNEMYGWDSYFIVLGLIAGGFHDLAKGMVENCLFEVEHYGTVVNANRTYYLTRSQPPFLASMINAILDDQEHEPGPNPDNEWLERAYNLAFEYHESWMQPEHSAGDTGLARYYDLDSDPIPELADDSTYFHDIIQWLIKNPDQDPGYLRKCHVHSSNNNVPLGSNCECNPKTCVMSELACVDGYSLTSEFYVGDRAMRESGFDTSFRFGPFSGSAHHYAPVCLNSLLYKYERDMASMASRLGRRAEEEGWEKTASQRAKALQKYLWCEELGAFADYDFTQSKSSDYHYLSEYFPLWAGLATQKQAEMMKNKLSEFERKGGLAMSSEPSGMQWDMPYGWAPAHWIVAEGLRKYGFQSDAARISGSFMRTIEHSFAEDGTVREKYDVTRGDANVNVTVGYSQNVIGFGWTNAVYLLMHNCMVSELENPTTERQDQNVIGSKV